MTSTQEEIKAKEIVDKFRDYTEFRNDGGHDEEVSNDHAKQCALIHVNGIIEVLGELNYGDNGGRADVYGTTKWQNIKTAINNLP